jgi:hypothetical protein
MSKKESTFQKELRIHWKPKVNYNPDDYVPLEDRTDVDMDKVEVIKLPTERPA